MCSSAGLGVFVVPPTSLPWWALGHEKQLVGFGTTQTWSSFGLSSPMFVQRWEKVHVLLWTPPPMWRCGLSPLEELEKPAGRQR